MERVVYEQMAQLDQLHWWYRARREVLAALIRRKARPKPGARLLEIGCGTGHNLPMLAEFGEVEGLELDDEARAVAEERLGRPVRNAPLPELSGVPERHYDLIAALDVIEHIDDDRAAMDSIAKRRKAIDHRPCPPMDVVGARRRQPSQAALFEAGTAPADRRLAAAA
jgi:2-polyprenyl-3-methyl-5-hydroxy-6-metoxy-1,4-benzoquinol methylase